MCIRDGLEQGKASWDPGTEEPIKRPFSTTAEESGRGLQGVLTGGAWPPAEISPSTTWKSRLLQGGAPCAFKQKAAMRSSCCPRPVVSASRNPSWELLPFTWSSPLKGNGGAGRILLPCRPLQSPPHLPALGCGKSEIRGACPFPLFILACSLC